MSDAHDDHDYIIFDPAKAPGVPEDVRDAVSVWPRRLSPARALKDRIVTRWIAKLCEVHLPSAKPQLLHFMSIFSQIEDGHDFVSAGRTHGLDAKAARALFDQGYHEAQELILTGDITADTIEELELEGLELAAPEEEPDKGAHLLALGLSGRAVDALLKLGVETRDDLYRLDESDMAKLKALKGVGKATVQEITGAKMALAATGMSPAELDAQETHDA